MVRGNVSRFFKDAGGAIDHFFDDSRDFWFRGYQKSRENGINHTDIFYGYHGNRSGHWVGDGQRFRARSGGRNDRKQNPRTRCG